MGAKKTTNDRTKDRISMCVPFGFYPDQADSRSSLIKVNRPSSFLVALCENGMRISGNMILEEDVPLIARFDFRDEKHSISCRFRVKWIIKNSYKAYGNYSYGLQFMNVSPDDRAFLHSIYEREMENTEQKVVLKN